MKNRPFVDRLGFALSGIVSTFRSEASFRMQIAAAAVMLIVLWWLRPPPAWWAIVMAMAGLVLAAELFNTALERVIDHLHPAHHPATRIAKDCAAAAVLVLSIAALGVFIALIVETWRL